MASKGYSAAAIKTLWDILLPFSDYAFNKAHSAAYGMLSYWTGYLKANFPAEYMAALLTSVKDDKDKMAIYLAECRRMGIKVLPPDVNSSDANFTPTGGDIRFGLSAVRNVGGNVVASITTSRKSKGNYTEFADYLRKVDAVGCNKRTVEALIKSGAYDSLGHTRKGLIQVYEASIDAVVDTKKAEAIGQFDLFGFGTESAPETDVFAVRVPDGEWDKSVLLNFEREMLGLYVSDHPLFGVEHILAAAAEVSIADLQTDAVNDGQSITVAGILSSVTRRMTKDGKAWAQVTLEDLEGAVEVLFFPASYAQVGMQIAEDAVVVVKGRVDAREDTIRLIGSDLTLPDLSEGPRGPLRLRINQSQCKPEVTERLREILSSHPGPTEVQVQLTFGNQYRARLPGIGVNPSPALMGDLKALLGPNALAG
jgi:DNA polymerase-3 subunit alpha